MDAQTAERLDNGNDNTKQVGMVIAAGLATSLLTIGLVWVLGNGADINVMGFYLWFVVPIGAIIAGLLAGSGYGIAARVLGVRVVTGVLVVIGAIQLFIYFGAKYAEFSYVFAQLQENPEFIAAAATNPEAAAFLDMGFFTYFDINTQGFAFDDGDGMGAWGYAFRLLEIAGFVGGGIGGLMMNKGAAYCESCATYMKNATLTTVPASLPPAKVKKKDIEGQENEAARQEQAWNDGHALAEDFLNAVNQNSPADVTAALEQSRAYQLENKKSGAVNLSYVKTVCPSCGNGHLALNRTTVVGEDTNVEVVAVLEVAPGMNAVLS